MSAITTLDKSTVLARAQAAINNRTRYVEMLFDAAIGAAAAHSAVADARETAAIADTAFEKAYRDAVAVGWTPAELSAAGLPTSSAPRRPARRSTPRRSRTTPAPTTSDTSTAPDDSASNDQQATA
ncbi:hypothetical protein [Rhodococcus sp. NBC_00297]|uniref:hypothetical protein n=1 Tax=Rhodococcus sp. NBC_00297 TaxID=2976005 RepID=UPI002E2CC154|nr:hypothetical protein [Rhodococcus sp. NBC_00297]